MGRYETQSIYWADDLCTWLKKHHKTKIELWVQIFKKGSGQPSVSWNDCENSNKKWGPKSTANRTLVPHPKVSKNITFIYSEPFQNKEFLYQKYVVEELSISEIATQISSAESTVHKYLMKFDIPRREPGKTIRKKRNLAFGKQVVKRKEIDHKKEQVLILKMNALRSQGFSYWKIADILNALKVPTKTRKGRWHARSVKKILDDNQASSVTEDSSTC